ncbi:MAG: hypothetical protein BGO14_08910 [Chlamydiales bacterium 38-26]|nr:glycosyltransferase family 1 protein [Chlamydiales bacterium]OJV11101.1 MAG: hypothetical protein BGO14_08910 [Chlamydiales bacterium 38-26]
MINRIDLFMPPENRSRYNVLSHFTIKLAEALSQAGVNCRILKAERDNPKPFLEALFNDPPDCTLSFNGLLPDSKGQFFCDMIKIPHVACLIDSPTHFLILASSPYSIITVPDRFSTQFFKGLKFENVLFMPHAVEKELFDNPEHIEKKYDVTMLSSCIDYKSLEESWPSSYPKSVCHAMHEAVEISLSDGETSCMQAFIQAIDRHIEESGEQPGILNYPEIIDQVEMYVKGKERVELLKSISDTPVNLFGAPIDLWKKYLKNQPNIIYHDPVNINIAIEIMRQSKIVLNSCAWLKDGTHERILMAIASGALVITSENIYMREHFEDRHSIAFYKLGQWKSVNQQVNEYLSNSLLRHHVVAKGQEIVKRKHTWDQRAKTLLKELPPIIKRIKSS